MNGFQDQRNAILPDYYVSQSIITDPGNFKNMFDVLPDSVPDIVECIHGLFLHIFWTWKYGVTLNDSQKTHVQLRHVSKILKKIETIDNSPLTAFRDLDKRFIGNCRDFSVFLCSILRHKGIPARARCGFARYFNPGKFEDHWICEYYEKREGRWISVDAQLDRTQKEVLGINFNTLDMPEGQFICGAEAWKLCRSGCEDPAKFGIFDMNGLWFVRGDFLRDLTSLNKVELLPWDSWGLIEGDDSAISDDDYTLLDNVAEMVTSNNPELYNVYKNNEKLKASSNIKSYVDSSVIEVAL